MLILWAGLCDMCVEREHLGMDDSVEIIEFHSRGWHWCPQRRDMIHDSMGCWEREESLKPKRIPLAERLGLRKDLK